MINGISSHHAAGSCNTTQGGERKPPPPIFLLHLRHYAPSSHSSKNQKQKPSCVRTGMSLCPYHTAKFYITVSEDAGQDCFGKHFYAYFYPKQYVSSPFFFFPGKCLTLLGCLRLCQHRVVTLMEICPELLEDKVIQKQSGNCIL